MGTRAWNERVQAAKRLETFGRNDALALVIGNTRALWAPFVEDLRAVPTRTSEARPLDGFVERAVGQALGQSLGAARVRSHVRFGHQGPPYPPLQRLAQHAGLAWLSPAYLSIHPTYGPWIALRAVVVFDADAATAALAPPAALSACQNCSGACEPALARALKTAPPKDSDAAINPLWIAVRDACPLGRDHRYTEPQIAYHYGKDREILRQAIRGEDG